jgi:AcrR family transcriptional regulator
MGRKFKEGDVMDEKRDRIISIAEQMFAHFGIQKTTMDDIAKKARMGKSTLYYYFKSKEEIFAEVILKDSKLFKSKLNQAVRQAVSPQEKISQYVLTRMKHLRELGNFYSTLTDEYLEHYAFVERTRKDFNDFEFKTLSKILEQGVAQGVFKLESIDIAARNFAIVLKGLEYPLIIDNGKSDIEKESNNLMHILFKGIEAR